MRIAMYILILLLTSLTACQDDTSSRWHPGMPLNKEKIIIGVIHVDDASSGYSHEHEIGIEEMQQKLQLRDNQIIRKFNVNESDVIMLEHMMREAITEGANIILATSWGHMDICEKLAPEYPNVIFANVARSKSNLKNLTHYFGRIYQARYLSGIVAGLKTQSNKIGYVSAKDKSNSEVTSSLSAFALGVASVNPSAKVYVRVTHNWFDPHGEAEATRELIGSGCDVITQHCNTSVPQIEAEKAGVWGIGYNSDMSKDAPGAVLTSVVWHWGVYYTYLVQSVINGTFTTAPYFGDLKDGMVDLTTLNDKLTTPAIAAAVAEARERIISGKCNIFDGVMETNDGRKIGIEGSTLSDIVIMDGIGWYYRNVREF
jgi:basic membrane protein A